MQDSNQQKSLNLNLNLPNLPNQQKSSNPNLNPSLSNPSLPNQQKSSNQNLKALAASIAHETRNSLSAIKGCCDIIKNNLDEAVKGAACDIIKSNLDEAVEYLELISVSSNRGLMIADMILTNIREGEINKDNFVNLSMAKVIKQTIKEYAFASNKEKELVNVDLSNDFVFKGDETLMIFVLFNLLKNSLYYKAKINIFLESDEEHNYLHFKDYGVGIAQDKLPNIFDNFFTNDKKGGTGLGLAFCKRVMQAFGGDISCKSIEGEGVEFCLRF